MANSEIIEQYIGVIDRKIVLSLVAPEGEPIDTYVLRIEGVSPAKDAVALLLSGGGAMRAPEAVWLKELAAQTRGENYAEDTRGRKFRFMIHGFY